MGLFGRDDSSSQESRPLPAASGRPEPGTQPQQAAIRTVIAGPTRVEGLLTGSGDVAIRGEVAGAVDCTAHVEVAVGGSVAADMHARSIVVAGTVRGDVTADERIELTPTADLRGNMTAPRILIADGATFHGQVEVKKLPRATKPDAQEKTAKDPGETKKAKTSSARRTSGDAKVKDVQ